MIFNGEISGYDNTTLRSETARSGESWKDGDRLYICFHTDNSFLTGGATYSSTEGWSVSWDGDLPEGEDLTCEVRYFDGPSFVGDFHVSLNPETGIYETLTGTYTHRDGSLTVNAYLNPKLARIRFTGTKDDQIYVYGITTNTIFAPQVNSYSTTMQIVPLTVDRTGSTPYIYGTFAYEDNRICIIGSDFAYSRVCKAEVLEAPVSGYMKIPSPESHNNWRNGFILNIEGVEFKLLPVPGYSDKLFLLGETETTEEQYAAIDEEATTIPSDAKKPQTGYYDFWETYVSKLNNRTSLGFYIPSSGEWTYAAQGGALSQGYTYAGSNIPGNVAWYEANSDNHPHDVKQLSPNELGFYDMSGNAPEWVSDSYYYYNSSYYYIYGGAYSQAENGITVSSSVEGRFDMNGGLRIALVP